MKRYFLLLIIILFSFTLIGCTEEQADRGTIYNGMPLNSLVMRDDFINKERNVVKVGYFKNLRFMTGYADDAVKSGYGYEYLQEIAKYTGWTYEYVYGDWPIMLDKFLAGEIDILPDVSRIPEREDIMSFPKDAMGEEHYYILVSPDNKKVNINDLSTFNDITIEVEHNSYQEQVLHNWVKENNIHPKIVYGDNNAGDRKDHVMQGVVDACVDIDYNRSTDEMRAVVNIGKSNFYLAVNKNRPDLLEQLNEAQREIDENLPGYTDRLRVKYFSDNIISSNLNAEETAWLSKHKIINVGYLKDYMPYTDMGRNGATGATVYLLDSIKERLLPDDVQFKYIGYDSCIEANKDFAAGNLDIIIPVYGDLWMAEQHGVLLTHGYENMLVEAICQSSVDIQNIKRVAITDKDPLSFFYPYNINRNMTFIKYENPEDCVDAVLNNEVDATYTNNYRAEWFMRDSNYSGKLKSVAIGKAELCVAIPQSEKPLLSILEKGISLVPSEDIDNKVSVFASQKLSYSYNDFFKEYKPIVGSVAGFIIIMLITLFSVSRSRAELEKANKQIKIQQREQAQANEKLLALNRKLETHQAALVEATEKAEKANEAKSIFLSNMSHDIRTPMNAIMGFTNMAKKNLQNESKTEECLDKISIAGEHLLSLINDILDVSYIDSGKSAAVMEKFKISDLVHNVVSIIQTSIEAKKQNFTVDVSGVKDDIVNSDSVLLKRALLNLLSNATKYTPSGGEISLTIKQDNSSKFGYGCYIFSVKDNGIGMSEEFLPHVFEAFERDNSVKGTEIQGTGLGTAIIKRIVDKLDGKVEAFSEKGKGSEFVLKFDLKLAEQDDKKDAEDNLPVGQRGFDIKKILLVEDVEYNREIAMDILEEAGFVVDVALNGLEAVEKIKAADTGEYSVVLMDIQMPIMDGYEAAKEIRKLDDDVNSHVPIIAVTANAYREDRDKALQAGMNGHISKPIRVNELIEILGKVI